MREASTKREEAYEESGRYGDTFGKKNREGEKKNERSKRAAMSYYNSFMFLGFSPLGLKYNKYISSSVYYLRLYKLLYLPLLSKTAANIKIKNVKIIKFARMCSCRRINSK